MTAVEVLAQHQLGDGICDMSCNCGIHDLDSDAIAVYQLDVLKVAGYVIIDLAEPDHTDVEGVQYFTHGTPEGDVWLHPTDRMVCSDQWMWTPEQATDIARQWLSAASVAMREYCNRCGGGFVKEHECKRP